MSEQHFNVATPADFTSVISLVLTQAKEITNQAAVITLTGDLGAGKTTLTQELAKHLNISEPVVSPTFGIMKVYELEHNQDFDQLVHIDAYRIESIDEVGPLRFEELFKQPRTLVCIEWPDKIASILPEKKVEVIIKIGDKEKRQIQISS